MIDVQQAVQVATQYAAQLFGNALNNLRLEEVELSFDEKHWYITIGFDESVPLRSGAIGAALENMMNPRMERRYKVVDVDSNTGKVRAVKMRQPLERAY
jgi:hypothetical protein